MRNLPLDYYEQTPLLKKCVVFLNAAKKLHQPASRFVGSNEVSFYLLAHAIELGIKSVVHAKLGVKSSVGHDIYRLAKQYQRKLGISEREMSIIRSIQGLNEGPGGLRYDNKIEGRFLPSIFSKGVGVAGKLIDKLIKNKFK